MKTGCRVILGALALGLTGCATMRGPSGGTATVEFVHPQKFSDIEMRNTPPDRAREILLPDLANYVHEQAALHIPAGDHLTLRITDINEAGWIRPIGPNPVRIVRQSQPARIDFDYTLKDATGETLASGQKTLSQLPEVSFGQPYGAETLPVVKQMLGNWISQLGLQAARTKTAAGGTR